MTNEPKIGDWVLYREYHTVARQIAAITPKLLKFEGIWPRQLNRSDKKVLGFAPDEATAERLKQSIDGIEGEYRRRKGAAHEEYMRREAAARASRNATIAKLFERGEQ